MDEKVLESVTALLRNQLTTQLLWTAILSVAAAAIGAYLGAYLGKKGERRAQKEDFASVLEEEVKRTFQTESVKASLADASGRAIESLRVGLQREMAFVTFQRELIARYQDALMGALREVSATSEFAKYEWRDDEIDSNRPKMTACLRGAILSSAMLKALNTISDKTHKELVDAVENVADRWDTILAFKTSNSPTFRAKYPQFPIPTPDIKNIVDGQSALNKAVSVLTDRVLTTISASVLPT
jgi:hypothetical protein